MVNNKGRKVLLGCNAAFLPFKSKHCDMCLLFIWQIDNEFLNELGEHTKL